MKEGRHWGHSQMDQTDSLWYSCPPSCQSRAEVGEQAIELLSVYGFTEMTEEPPSLGDS